MQNDKISPIEALVITIAALGAMFLYILPIAVVCNAITDAKNEIITELQKPREVVVVYPQEPDESALEIELNDEYKGE